MATSRSSSRSRALRETWTPEQAAEYAALREFRLLQLLSKDRRAAATAQRLGVFSAPSSPQRANVPAAEQDAGDKRGRRYSTKQQERRILRHDRYVELQQSVRLWRTAKAFFYWRAYVRSVRSAPGADTVDCFAAASSSAPPPPLSTFVFNAGEPVRFDFGVTNPPPAFAPPPPPQPSSLGEPIAPIPSGVRALVAEWPPLQPRSASKREGRPKAAGDAPATPDAKRAAAEADAMEQDAPSTPPRDFAQEELELLTEASDVLNKRSSGADHEAHFDLRRGRGGGRGKGAQ